MAAVEFGKLVTQHMERVGLSQNRLASRLGELSDGRIFDATQVRMIREGRRRLDQMLVQRIIDVLHLDEDQADEMWAASALLPPGVTAEELRQLRNFRRAPVAAVVVGGGASSDLHDQTKGMLSDRAACRPRPPRPPRTPRSPRSPRSPRTSAKASFAVIRPLAA